METVRVNLGPRSYDIAVTSGDHRLLADFVRAALPKSKSALVVTDGQTLQYSRWVTKLLEPAELQVRGESVPVGEASKSHTELTRLYNALYAMAADRNTAVIALGGGVVGDLAGFAAATYNRGLPLFMIPTSLLAMVDSSVGGKTGINHPKGKNLIGAFHQPAGVWIDISLLETLPEREFRSGLAEVVKYGVILDADFFAYLEANTAAILTREPAALLHIVARSCRLKADVVEKDEREETGLRAVLNYGHTFAHAFETVGGYGAWSHGEAVAAGMICASRLAEKLGHIGPEITLRQERLLTTFSLPTKPLPEWRTDELIAVMRRDKKATVGKLRFVLPTRLGEVKLVDDVPEALVHDVLEGR